jgi:hypothetical protein
MTRIKKEGCRTVGVPRRAAMGWQMPEILSGGGVVMSRGECVRRAARTCVNAIRFLKR